MTTRSKILPNRLKEVRTQAGITQAELAARVGTHPSYISNVENYHFAPTIERREQIAAFLQVAITDIWPEPEKEYSHA